MNSVRLKSSFIYLANAVNDLRGNWALLAVVIAPILLAAALCLLPDALNLQRRLAANFEPPGSQNISYTQTIGYTSADSTDAAKPSPSPTPSAPALQEPQPYSWWFTTSMHVIFGALSLMVTLITLVTLRRVQSGLRQPTMVAEAIEIYSQAVWLAPGFIWVTLLQLFAPGLGLFLFQAASTYMQGSMGMWAYMFLVLMIVIGSLIYAWLYFAQYALVFDGKHSFHALLFSRDLVRKRFFRVAIRVVVFLAVWSGYNSWAWGTFVVVSLLFGPVGVVTGFLGTTIFLLDLCEIAVNFATNAFIVAAGLRLYQDLRGPQLQTAAIPSASPAEIVAMQPTAALPRAAL